MTKTKTALTADLNVADLFNEDAIEVGEFQGAGSR